MENSSDALLSVRGLCRNYPGFQLKSLTFDLREGKITGFIGRNGAGKTTAINAILSFIRRDGGEVFFRGVPLTEKETDLRAKIGFVSAGMTYYTSKPLRVITKVTKSFYPGWDDGIYQRYMRLFGLSEDKTPSSLSNGMKIKYALVLALSHGAELFILDEPTSGLDPVSREELVEIFLRLRDEGKTVLFSTHITSDLEKCADRILLIREGTLQADEALDDFRRKFRIAEITGPVPPQIKRVSRGACRVRDGFTVLVPGDECGGLNTREASLEEIIVHLEKEADQ